MATIELVEQLRKHANVSYKDAKEALEATDNDLLEALIYLESQGKVTPPSQGGSYSTQRNTKQQYNNPTAPKETLGDLIRKFFSWVLDIVRKGNRNSFVIHKNSDHILSMPITVMTILLIACFWLTLPLLLIGMLFGFKYNFYGPDIKNTSINDIMDKASDTAEDFKTAFKNDKPENPKPPKEKDDE